MRTDAHPPPLRGYRLRRRDDRRAPLPAKLSRNDPLWAKLSIILGAVVTVISVLAVAVPKIAASWFVSGIKQVDAIPTELRGTDVNGPINFLLLGLDQRNTGPDVDLLRSDSIILVHIPATHDRVFMISIPRDLRVDIPAFPETKFPGDTDKINAAFANGAKLPNGQRDTSPEGRARGAALAMQTINNMVPGGLKFNGVAIIDFEGFKAVLQAMGGVNMCVDEDTYSIRFSPSGVDYGYDLDLGNTEQQAIKRNLSKHYPVGCYHMEPWEALDFSRQRDWLEWGDGDYGRQRHQQQLLAAIVNEAMSTNTITNFGKIKDLQKAAGNLLTMDLGGNKLEDWVLTLSSLRAHDIVMVKTYGGEYRSVDVGGVSFQRYDPDLKDLLKSAQADTVFDFLANHPNWVAGDTSSPSTSASSAGQSGS